MNLDPVAAFLYREARLMDEHRYQEWLTLWESSDTLYWVPCNDDDIDPRRQVSIIYDDHDRLMQRDGLHPNVEGTRMVAETVAQALEGLIKK